MPECYIKVSCPACDQHIELPEKLIDESVVCPNCSQPFIVPKPAQPPKRTQSGWIAGVIILLVSIVLFFVSGFLVRLNIPYISYSPQAAQLLFAYGVAYLILNLVTKGGAVMPVRISLFQVAGKKARRLVPIGQFQSSLVVLMSAICAPALLFLWNGGLMLLKPPRDNDSLLRGRVIRASEEGNGPIFEAAERAIREKLAHPSSAKFEIAGLILPDEKDGDCVRVQLGVESQDKNGTMIRSTWNIELRKDKRDKGASWSAQNVIMFNKNKIIIDRKSQSSDNGKKR